MQTSVLRHRRFFLFLPVFFWAAFLADSVRLRAQTVTVTDSDLAAWLNMYYSQAMNGNLMDTQHPSVTGATSVSYTGTWSISDSTVQDLTPLSYFIRAENLTVKNVFRPVLGAFPASIRQLELRNSIFGPLPALPQSLRRLSIWSARTTGFPVLPDSLEILEYSTGELAQVPPLTSLTNLRQLWLNNNRLAELPPVLPALLEYLSVDDNFLTHIDSLPPTLQVLYARNNRIRQLPVTFPQPLIRLHLDSNEVGCLPRVPVSIQQISLTGNPIRCVPQYFLEGGLVPFLPLCALADTANNPEGCPPVAGIGGRVFSDANGNCQPEGGEAPLRYCTVRLWNAAGDFVAATDVTADGRYFFAAGPGSYTVRAFPEVSFTGGTTCVPGMETAVVLDGQHPVRTDVHFPLACAATPDYAVAYAGPTGLVFPGQTHRLECRAGELSALAGAPCFLAGPVTVTVSVTGPVTYAGSVPGTPAPTVSGTVFTYTITDASVWDHRVAALLRTDTTATADDEVCVTVTVTAGGVTETVTENNTLRLCYPVFNSYDPNVKTTYPERVPPGYDDGFTYTVHFQNLGNAPAINIRVTDRLDYLLDPASLQITDASHPYSLWLERGEAVLLFTDINLPDSASDPEGSVGHFSYRVKPRAPMVPGDVIYNKANIYFDYNEFVGTNVTVNRCVTEVLTVEPEEMPAPVLYPNPATDRVFFDNPGYTELDVTDLTGRILMRLRLPAGTGIVPVDVSGLGHGLYFLRFAGPGGQQRKAMLVKGE